MAEHKGSSSLLFDGMWEKWRCLPASCWLWMEKTVDMYICVGIQTTVKKKNENVFCYDFCSVFFPTW